MSQETPPEEKKPIVLAEPVVISKTPAEVAAEVQKLLGQFKALQEGVTASAPLVDTALEFARRLPPGPDAAVIIKTLDRALKLLTLYK